MKEVYIETKSYGSISKKEYYTTKKINLEVEFINARLKEIGIPYEVVIKTTEDIKKIKDSELNFYVDNLNKTMKETNSEELKLFRKAFKDNLEDIDNHSSFKF